MMLRSFTLGFGLAVALSLAPAAPAMAQSEEPSALQRLFGSLGLLDIPNEEDAIDYRDRAPLVVPPSAGELPPPRSPESIRTLNPEWPTDPEIVKRRAAAAKDKRPIEERRGDFYLGRALRPDELRPGAARRAPAGASTETAGGLAAAGRETLRPNELGFKGWFQKEEPIQFSGEPPRTRLTEPPSGYLTPSPNQPYGVVEAPKPNSRKTSPFDRLLSPSDKELEQ